LRERNDRRLRSLAALAAAAARAERVAWAAVIEEEGKRSAQSSSTVVRVMVVKLSMFSKKLSIWTVQCPTKDCAK
jgi:hypothetical protein